MIYIPEYGSYFPVVLPVQTGYTVNQGCENRLMLYVIVLYQMQQAVL